MLTSPKLMLPFQIARAIRNYFACREVRARGHVTNGFSLLLLTPPVGEGAPEGKASNPFKRFCSRPVRLHRAGSCGVTKRSEFDDQPYAANSSCWREIPRNSKR